MQILYKCWGETSVQFDTVTTWRGKMKDDGRSHMVGGEWGVVVVVAVVVWVVWVGGCSEHS